MKILLALFLFPTLCFGLKLVTTSPQATELVRQLGKGTDLIAGAPVPGEPSQTGLLAIGPYFMPSLERLVRLSPDWVIADTTLGHDKLLRGLKATASIRRFDLAVTSPEALFSESRRLLLTLYGESESKLLRHFSKCGPKPGSAQAASFIAFAWASPPILFGGPSFLSGLLSKFGERNLSPVRLKEAYPQVSEEWLLNQKPEKIYYLEEGSGSEKMIRELTEKLWPGNRLTIIALDSRYFSRATFSSLAHLAEIKIATNGACRAP